MLTTLSVGKPFCQKDIHSELAFLWTMKLDSSDIHHFAQEYVFRFERESYRLYKDDEFAIHQAGNELQEKIDKLELNTIYKFTYDSEFEDYDFINEGFSCLPFGDNAKFKLMAFTFGSKLNSNTSIQLHFLNSSEINFFPIEKEKANIFIKERKNFKNGKIDRSIILNVSFVLSGVQKTTDNSNKTDCILTANILQVDFLDNHEILDAPLATVNTNFGNEFNESTKKEEPAKEVIDSKNTDSDSGSNQALINEINTILSNTALSQEMKASLIKATMEFYQNKPNGVLTDIE